MKVNLTGVTSHQCSKQGCLSRRLIQRHHKGCEKMWLRHYRRLRSKRFREFKLRYHEFREEDIVPLCAEHHEELHSIYAPIISFFVREKGFKPCAEWTWDEAEELMQHLRDTCNRWLTGLSQ